MLARNAHIVAVDFESTGVVAGYPDEPWQIGLVPIVGGHPVISGSFTCYLRVAEDRPFNPCTPGSWRLRRHELAVAKTLPDLLPVLRDHLLGFPLVAHNAATEKKFLRQAWPLHRPGPWIDTLKLVRIAFPGFKKHALEEVLNEAGLKSEVSRLAPDRSAHDALYDAVASAVVFCHLLRQPEWAALTVDDLTRAVSGLGKKKTTRRKGV
jgi:DNA polymerase III epsilon subunit-like protein